MMSPYRFTYALKHMYKTLKHNVRHRILYSTNFEKYYSSALYLNGKNAYKSFAYLSPYLDIDEKFADINRLQKEITLRRMDIDVIQLKKAWDFYQKMTADKCALERNNSELTIRVKTLLNITERTAEQEQEIVKLRTQLTVIRQDMKMMKEAIWDLDEDVIEKILKLPNELDPKTPIDKSIVLKSIGNAPELSEKNKKSHIDIGTSLGLLEYKNPFYCYLTNDAALFELAVLAHAARILGEDDVNTIRVIGADFSRSFVVEGCGLNHEDPAATFIIENHNEVERGSPNRMHLVGGASLVSFLALHAKQLINPNNFPLKYFATGRQYTPLPRDAHAHGLLTVCQASVAHTFAMTKNARNEEYKMLLDNLLETVCRLYDDLHCHYRVIMRPASELQPWESLRISFEMWSPFMSQYIEIGHISACGDYFSKRLRIAYQTPTGRDFPAVISGTVLSVPRLLACMLEQNPDKFVIPPKVIEFVTSDDRVTV
ncbi:hypothetical protein HN011_006531 [Eciton burchellii]|nr:hypothetical protein HN011_006531 [Eciton burchellii]